MKSVRVLACISLSSAAVVSGLVFLFARLWPYATSTLQNAFQAVSYACQVVWVQMSREQIAFAIVGSTLLVGFCAWLVYSMYRAVRLAQRAKCISVTLPARVQSIAAAAGLDACRISVVEDDRAFAMTVGMRKPEVIVSTSAVRKLSDAELQAVFEHEAHHVRQREPVRRAFLALALLWVPNKRVRAQLHEQYVAASEVEADMCVRDQRTLGSALLQLVTPPIVAAGFSPLDARVERLVNPNFRQSAKFTLRFAVFTLIVVANAVVFVPKSIGVVYGNLSSSTTAAHLDICRQKYELMLQSRDTTCGKFSSPQTCADR